MMWFKNARFLHRTPCGVTGPVSVFSDMLFDEIIIQEYANSLAERI